MLPELKYLMIFGFQKSCCQTGTFSYSFRYYNSIADIRVIGVEPEKGQ